MSNPWRNLHRRRSISMTLARRIAALEAKGAPDDDDKLTNWGPGFEHLPPTTRGALRRMLQAIHDSGAGRLPICHRHTSRGMLFSGPLT
jgi:hypothetical protein